MMRKTISMPDQMGEWISGRINRGQFNNESEYFRDLVRKDQEEENRRQYLLARLSQGEKQIKDGQYTVLESDQDIENLFEAIKTDALG